MTKIQIYRAKNGEWRWRMRRQGRIVAESGEGYKRRATMQRSLSRLTESIREGRYTY